MPSEDCPLGQVWGFSDCACITCEPCGPGCLGRENPYDCSSKCLCEDPFCPQTEHCLSGQEWDFINCGCIGEIIPCEPCKPGCYGRENPYDCSSQCLCEGPYCIPPENCPLGQKWDFMNCGCIKEIIRTCSPTECKENQNFNPKTCNCEFVVSKSCEPCEPACGRRENPDDCSSPCDQTGCFNDLVGPTDLCKYEMECQHGKWDYELCACPFGAAILHPTKRDSTNKKWWML